MKHTLSILALLLATAAQAQQPIYYIDAGNKDMWRPTSRRDVIRTEIILPTVGEYQVLKADLHTHTFYSDADVTPNYRVQEAWTDGLDVLAITDHVEYRRWEGNIISFLKGYFPDGVEVVNANVIRQNANSRGILNDLNIPYKVAKPVADNYGITLIPGVEITREPLTVGHYNALFIKDANTIYDADPVQSIKNARAQGALIMQNHPGWRRKDLNMIEFEQKVYDQNLIDGVEIMNGAEMYPAVVSRASEKKCFMAANTDAHNTTARDYNNVGQMRDMTLIFARENTLEAVKEALQERRTLACAYGTIAGEEQLVRDFFNACIKYQVVSKGDNEWQVSIQNSTSMTWVLSLGGNPLQLRPFTSRIIPVKKSGTNVKVINAWIPGEKLNPVFKLDFETVTKQ